jgi:hypothetical protein
MAALYRIVQDEHPPLPDNISPVCFFVPIMIMLTAATGQHNAQALEHFLRQCFQKDPNRRCVLLFARQVTSQPSLFRISINAEGLLRESWLKEALSEHDQVRRALRPAT